MFCQNCGHSADKHKMIPGLLFATDQYYYSMRLCMQVVSKYENGIAECCNCKDFKPIQKEIDP